MCKSGLGEFLEMWGKDGRVVPFRNIGEDMELSEFWESVAIPELQSPSKETGI